MQYSVDLILTSVVLAAQLVQAVPHENHHRRFHAERRLVVTDVVTKVVTDIEVDVVTEIVTVTVGGAPATTPAAGYTSISSAFPVDPVKSHSAAEHHYSAPLTSLPSAYPTVSAYIPPPAISSSPSAYPTIAPYVPPPAISSSPSAYPTVSAYYPPVVSSTAPSSSAAPVSSAPAYTSSSAPKPSSTGMSLTNLSPDGKKAGLSGYIGIQDKPSFQSLAPYISWYSDYSPNTPSVDNVMGIGMLWGAQGSPCPTTSNRLQTYNRMTATTTPEIMFGFYEPDCTCEMSSEMSTSDAAAQWDALIAPLASKGTILGSPSMCKQKDEDFLTPFNASISRTWDVTSIHINKPDLAGAKEDVEYYVKTYGKPVWVSEFACVNDQPGWAPCTDREQITSFINDVVAYFQSNDNVVAYGPSNGEGLGDVWPLTDSSTGELTETGMTYLNAIKGL